MGFALALTTSCEKHCPEDHALELRDGRVCFGKAREYPNPDLAGAPQAEDLDGDGDLDILALADLDDGGELHALRVMVNTDGRTFELHSLELGDGASRLTTGDLDGDGDVDVVAQHYLGHLWVLRNDGRASFEIVNELEFERNGSADIVDVNGDRAAEVVVSGTSMFVMRDATTAGAQFESVGANPSSDDSCLYSGDVTGDGFADVFTSALLFRGGAAGLEAPTPLALPRGGCGIVFDLDGDAIDDVTFCQNVFLGPLTETTQPVTLRGVPEFGGYNEGPCRGGLIARGAKVTPTFTAWSDDADWGVEDGPTLTCSAITAVLPNVNSTTPLAAPRLGTYEVAGVLGYFDYGEPSVDLVDVDGDGWVDRLKKSGRDPITIRFGRACD